ncbi:MAG TPA: bifunctional oligoribonuclease/PAP phosphatase NrnA [Acidimicrobiia bacterium]|nr:bifunctional oligoribonuclease/PAP phosphatase NrnA [Acidimicrobiia bacterium]
MTPEAGGTGTGDGARESHAADDVRVALARAAEAIRHAPLVGLACHINPDGDALGSMLAMHHALRAAGMPSTASFSEPFVIAPHYRDLPGLDLLTPPDQFPREPAVMVTFDSGSLGRLGDLERPAKAAGELVVVDHHVSNQRYGTINVIDPKAAASGVLVRRLIAELGIPLTRDAAVCLYAALVCDTGRFQYESTTVEVFDLARELAAFDLPIPELSRTLFEEHRFAYLQLLADALTRAQLVPDKRFVWTTVSQADLAEHGVTFEEIEGLIDVVRRTREASVACVLKEGPDHTWRISLRSLGDVDVRLIAEQQGGGGHRFAAGFTSDEMPEQIVAKILAAL